MSTIPITAAVAVVVLDPLTERMRPPDRVHAYTNADP